ncbi:MAG: hypothetical protein JST01_19105, partial [Cyanobacteria bacterium SZAS TMP-1]|nr:hypothetical protein [Cyanobacteria bacterium SZAS TMP-1]
MTVPAGHAFSANAGGWQSAAGAAGHSPFGSFGSSNTQATQSGALSNFHVQHAVNHAFLGAAAASANSNDLNLASSKQTFLADNLANFHDLTILVGGTREVITSDSRLTAAEVVAAQQVLTGGTQTIRLNSSGTAIGGTVTLNNNLLTALDSSVGGSIGSLTISHGVKVIDTLSQLSLSGYLSNYGSILTAATTPGATDTISAASIFNAAGGAISSYTGAAGGLFSADAILNALTSVTNYGTISSAGNLTINAPVVYNV